MKHTYLVIGAAIAAVALSPAVQARSLRADIQCPYGNGGIAWAPTAGNPQSVNTGVTGAFSSLFTAPSGQISSDDVGLAVTAATQYNTYLNTPPAASTCPEQGGDTDVSELVPLAQVMNYTMAANAGVSSAGDMQIEFNFKNAVTATNASFTIAGVTFSAASLTSANESDFLFSSTGSFLGSITGDIGSATLNGGVLPTGWTRSGGTVNAPEIDARSGAGAVALLLAGLFVMSGRRRRA